MFSHVIAQVVDSLTGSRCLSGIRLIIMRQPPCGIIDGERNSLSNKPVFPQSPCLSLNTQTHRRIWSSREWCMPSLLSPTERAVSKSTLWPSPKVIRLAVIHYQNRYKTRAATRACWCLFSNDKKLSCEWWDEILPQWYDEGWSRLQAKTPLS